MKIIVTGAAGFIGYHTSKKLLERGDCVIGVDNLNTYYDVSLKVNRLRELEGFSNFNFIKCDLADRTEISRLVKEIRPAKIIHLAAQAGVRYSIENPFAYIESNIVGFINVLEACRHNQIEHLVYASSSSVYGANKAMPFSVNQAVDHPLSLYAATKKSNELMAHTYSHLYSLPTTGLRFFTVYGPWGRPDMAMYIFAKAIFDEKPIDVFNKGEMLRDFTYIDDIVEGVIRCCDRVATKNQNWDGFSPDLGTSSAPYRVYNIGNNKPVQVSYVIECLENAIGKKAKKNYLPMQLGDVPATYANVDALSRDVGFIPGTSIEVGIDRFIRWYREYHFNK